MKLESRAVADLKPYERNPRINRDAVDAVARSITDFGWRVPIVITPEGEIVAGHTRLMAAQKLGLEKVPVHVAHDLTPEQVKAYRIADNKTAEIALACPPKSEPVGMRVPMSPGRAQEILKHETQTTFTGTDHHQVA